MRGDIVIVRAYGGIPLIRRVWEEGEASIQITNDENMDLLLAGKTAVEPIGFPKEDVFQFNPEVAKKINSFPAGWDWDELIPV